MRPIVVVAVLSACLWWGILWGTAALTNALAPSLIPRAQQSLQATLVNAERHVRKRIAFLRAKRWIPA